MGAVEFINQLKDYNLLQSKLEALNKIDEKKEKKTKGYIASSSIIKKWINMDYLFRLKIFKNNKSNIIEQFIKDIIKKRKKGFNFQNITNDNIVFLPPRLFSEKNFPNLVNENYFKNLIKLKENEFAEVKYIFKKFLFILFFEKYQTIKLFYHKQNDKIINLTFIFDYPKVYEHYVKTFEKMESQEIIKYLLEINILYSPKQIIVDDKEGNINFTVFNEEEFSKCELYFIDKKIQIKSDKINSEEYNNNDKVEIKKPSIIKFNLINEISYRGLENVGATCYMNATLQCLANIKPITNYFLNDKNYAYLYDNLKDCIITMEYTQVLVGLFCNDSKTGFYCPKKFKEIISEYNPLFKGIQANDSKDLIIFLLEIMNNELVKIHNQKKKEKYNKNKKENESYQQIDISNENDVLNNFLSEYKKTHCTVIGDQLCGFQKSIFFAKLVEKKLLISIFLIV